MFLNYVLVEPISVYTKFLVNARCKYEAETQQETRKYCPGCKCVKYEYDRHCENIVVLLLFELIFRSLNSHIINKVYGLLFSIGLTWNNVKDAFDTNHIYIPKIEYNLNDSCEICSFLQAIFCGMSKKTLSPKIWIRAGDGCGKGRLGGGGGYLVYFWHSFSLIQHFTAETIWFLKYLLSMA